VGSTPRQRLEPESARPGVEVDNRCVHDSIE